MADTHSELRCPACQKVMKKVFISNQGFNVDICIDGCGGIFFDNREFKYLDEQHENIDDIINAINEKEFIKVDESIPRYCPACGAKMVKNYSSIKKEIQIDDCYSCGGKFLDNGELIKFRDEYKNESERTADVLKFVNEQCKQDLLQLEQELQRQNSQKSLLRKFFEAFIC